MVKKMPGEICTISLHYFHMYAVKNRVDCSSCSMNVQDKAISINECPATENLSIVLCPEYLV